MLIAARSETHRSSRFQYRAGSEAANAGNASWQLLVTSHPVPNPFKPPPTGKAPLPSVQPRSTTCSAGFARLSRRPPLPSLRGLRCARCARPDGGEETPAWLRGCVRSSTGTSGGFRAAAASSRSALEGAGLCLDPPRAAGASSPQLSSRAEAQATPAATPAPGNETACQQEPTFLNLSNLGGSGTFLEREEDQLAC